MKTISKMIFIVELATAGPPTCSNYRGVNEPKVNAAAPTSPVRPPKGKAASRQGGYDKFAAAAASSIAAVDGGVANVSFDRLSLPSSIS